MSGLKGNQKKGSDGKFVPNPVVKPLRSLDSLQTKPVTKEDWAARPKVKATVVNSIFEASTRVSPGTYWLGDPCYNVPSEQWHEWLEDANSADNRFILDAEVPGRGRVIALSTQWGDGQYTDTNGNSYGVDAGLIGLVPYKEGDDVESLARSSRLVTFDREVTCFIDTRGEEDRKGRFHTLTFGDIQIETGDGDCCDDCGFPEDDCACEDDRFCEECGDELSRGNFDEFCDDCNEASER